MEFPRKQVYYDIVLNLLDKLLWLLQPYITLGLEGDEFVPKYFLDAAGNLVDIITNDIGNTSSRSSDDFDVTLRVTERRMTIERAVQIIDRIMIIIFQVNASLMIPYN